MDERSARIAATFDSRARSYRDSHWHRVSAQRLVELCRLPCGARVLDAGTGTGFAALHAAEQVGERGRVTGVDISAGMLSEARAAASRRGLLNVDFVLNDAVSLPQFAAGSFDVVTCATALIYIPVAPGLREWHRLLRPDGLVAFSTMEAGSPLAARLFRECAAEYGLALEDPCAPLGTPAACREALEAAGFHLVDVRAEPTEFSPRDLEKAWESNLRAETHQPVTELPDAQLRELEARYARVLHEQMQADPSRLLHSDMLYVTARRPPAAARKGLHLY